MDKEQIIKTIKETVKNHKLTYAVILTSKKNKEIKDFILNETVFLNEVQDMDWKTRIYCIINNIKEFPKCKMCGSPIKRRIKSGIGFATYCSPKCECLDPYIISKTNETNMKKYGCKWSFQSENNRSKTKLTMNNRYGCDYAQQNKNIKKNSLQKMKELYGHEMALQCPEIKNRMAKLSMEKLYNKLLKMKDISPLFSLDELIDNGRSYIYTWKCNKCGSEFESFIDKSWFKQGQNKTYARCPSCFPRICGTSSGEDDIANFISEIYDGEIRRHRRILRFDSKSHSKFEIDIYLPDVKLGFEFNGLFFHSELNGTPKNYHLRKTEIASENGIKLIHIFENEWIEKKELIKGRIKNLLGLYDKNIFARKCIVEEVDSSESYEFQESNHIQGGVHSSVNIGLKTKDGELIALMTFSKSRFSKKYEWELVRFCNKIGYHIPGAAGKLLKYFERKYSPKSIVSYADRKWSNGNLYNKLGFTFIRNSPPDYWYFKGRKVYSRIRFQKHKLKNILKNYNKNLSEWENMRNNKFNRFFDCGNMVFVKNY